MKYINVCFLAVCLPLMACTQQLPDSVTRQLKAGIAGFMDRYHSPSMVVAVVHNNAIIFSDAQGYADREKKILATVDYPYPILSVTKLFTATMFMQLKQKGKLHLEDDIRTYLPEFTSRFPLTDNNGISLLQLATHTAGLARNTHADIVFAKQIDEWIINRKPLPALTPATKQELLASLPAIRLEYPAFKLLSCQDRLYSNLGYSLLGIAAERAAKKDYVQYIRENIFKPLGMRHSGFDSDIPKPLLAKGYFFDDSSKIFEPTPTFYSNGALYAGGMYSTVNDLAKFISFQFDTSSEANDILSKDNRAMMASFRIGWKTDYPFVFHEGAMLGYRCIMVYNPELKIGWVILTNTSEIEFSRINRYFAELLTPVFASRPDTGIQRFEGLYKLEGGGDSILITINDNQLFSSYLSGVVPRAPLLSSGNRRFKGVGRGSYTIGYEFISDENGKILYLNLGQLKWIKQE